jgi:hypothetical protein
MPFLSKMRANRNEALDCGRPGPDDSFGTGRDPGPAAGRRHTVITVTTPHKLDG